MRRLIACLALGLVLTACATFSRADAEGLTPRSRVAQPTYVEAPDYKAHNWYLGGVAGYAWTPEEFDDTYNGGIIAGYLWRPTERFGAGVELDYVFRDLGDFAVDDGVASVRGRAGVFLAPGSFLYGTVGVAYAESDIVPDGFDRGLVVGGGIEQDLIGGWAIRAEALHYRHTDEYFGWGEDGSTAARAGVLLKF